MTPARPPPQADQINYEDPRRYYLSMELPLETRLMASGGGFRPDWLKYNVQCGLGLQRVRRLTHSRVNGVGEGIRAEAAENQLGGCKELT